MPDGNIQARIVELHDEQAIRVLSMVVEHEYPEEIAAARVAWPDLEPDLGNALIEAGLSEYLPSPQTSVGDGELARTALTYVAQVSKAQADVVRQAITLSESPSERFDPATTAIGILVLVILQTEVKFERQSNGRWRFLIHKKPMRDSTLGHLLTTFIGRFIGGPK